jgi:hypothetical protein
LFAPEAEVSLYGDAGNEELVGGQNGAVDMVVPVTTFCMASAALI